MANLAPPSLLGLARRWPSYPRRVSELPATGLRHDLKVVRLRKPVEVRRWKAQVRNDGRMTPAWEVPNLSA